MYDSVDWYYDGQWVKYPMAIIIQFKEDGVAYGYDSDYTHDPNDRLLYATYSYQFDGNKGKMIIEKVEGYGQSLVGSVFDIKYDGKQDAILMWGRKDLPPQVYTHIK